jgi:hypothetical protein
VHSNVTTLVYEEIREGLDEKVISLPSPPLPPYFSFALSSTGKNIGG